MSRLQKLFKHSHHDAAANTVFMSRLRFMNDSNDLPSKADCINILKSYLPLYLAMEERLVELSQSEKLPAYLKLFTQEPYANRSKKLEDDIFEMEKIAQDDKKNLITVELKATTKMIKMIKSDDPMTLLACLTVRVFGDAFGGQALQKYMQQVFDSQLTGHFYNSLKDKGTQRDLGRFINDENLFTDEQNDEKEKKFITDVYNFFDDHVLLFNELEQQRKALVIANASNSINNAQQLPADNLNDPEKKSLSKIATINPYSFYSFSKTSSVFNHAVEDNNMSPN